MTPGFWSAFADDINGRLAVEGRSISTSRCHAGLRSLFGLAGGQPIARIGLHATDVVVQGKTATARETGGSSQPIPVRFVEQGGRWRLNCCVGRQVEEQPQTSYRTTSQGMMPTLHVGQVVVSDNATLRAHPPGLGAIVVFHPPAGAAPPNLRCGAPHEGAGSPRPCGIPTAAESSEVFIKRVVGPTRRLDRPGERNRHT